MRHIFLFLISLSTFSQSDIVWLDLTDQLEDKSGGWGIGNACGEDFYLYGIIKDDLDMKGDNLEILNSHVKIEGKIINVGEIVYLCDSSILEILDKNLRVDEIDNTVSLKVFPNPVESELNISGIEVNNIEIYDTSGMIVKQYKTFGNRHRILVDNLSSGVYYLRLNNLEAKKIIKL